MANKIIQGKQMSITFHVDDLKISHAATAKLYFTEMVKPDKSRYFTDFSVKPVVK